jgi:hypothetical protein
MLRSGEIIETFIFLFKSHATVLEDSTIVGKLFDLLDDCVTNPV